MEKWKSRYLESNATFDAIIINQSSRNFEFLNDFLKLREKKKWKTPLDVEVPSHRKDKNENVTTEHRDCSDEIKRSARLKMREKSDLMLD